MENEKYIDINIVARAKGLKSNRSIRLGGYAGRNKKVKIEARPYLKLDKMDTEEIIDAIMDYLKEP